jgi:hypothetical protein
MRCNFITMLRKLLSSILCFSFVCQQILPAGQRTAFAQAALDMAGVAGSIPALKPDIFRPAHLRYLAYDGIGPSFTVHLDRGDANEADLDKNSKEILKYFLTGITLPDNVFWVNLRPDSPDQMIDNDLARTDFGKVLLEADVQLKKDTALHTSPNTREGREYWNRLYKRAEELFGQDIPNVPTLCRPWIVPDEIIVREAASSAYIYKATLKVMLEQDYLSRATGRKAIGNNSAVYDFEDERLRRLNEYSSHLLRELIVPQITREINSCRRYAGLRQVYYSLVLSTWFKDKFKNNPGMYASRINTKDMTGIRSAPAWDKTEYFNAYKRSFEKGEYSLQENVNSAFGQSVRTYVSGGIAFFPSTSSAVAGNNMADGGIRGQMQKIVSRLKNPFVPNSKKEKPLSVQVVRGVIHVEDVARPQSDSNAPPIAVNTVPQKDTVPAKRPLKVSQLLDELRTGTYSPDTEEGWNMYRVQIAALGGHSLASLITYAAAFKQAEDEGVFNYKPIKILDAGKESVAVELENSLVLKISKNEFFSQRTYEQKFDAQIIDQGTIKTRNGEVYYLIQPKLEMTATDKEVDKFENEIGDYKFIDKGVKQIGFNRNYRNKNGTMGRWELVDPGAVGKRGQKKSAAVYTNWPADSSRDGGTTGSEAYRADIDSAIEQGIILDQRSAAQKLLAAKYAHFSEDGHSPAWLTKFNTRRLSPIEEQIFKIILAEESGHPARVMELGAGAGATVAHMKSLAGNRELRIEMTGLIPVAPRFVLSASWEDLSAAARKAGKNPNRVSLRDAFELQEKGFTIFTELPTPFIEKEYINQFSNIELDHTVSLLIDKYGDFFYAALNSEDLKPLVDKALSWLETNGIFYCGAFSTGPQQRLAQRTAIPDSFVGIISAEDTSLLFLNKKSRYYDRLSVYLSKAALAGKRANLFVVDNFQGLVNILNGGSGVPSFRTMMDWQLRDLVRAATANRQPAERLREYARNFPEQFSRQSQRNGLDEACFTILSGGTNPGISRDGGEQGDKQKPGGIDFRGLPVATQHVGAIPAIDQRYMIAAASLNLEKELPRIEKMIDVGLQPSTQRIGECAAACRIKGETEKYSEALLTCIAGILRMEEAKAQPTEKELRELLVQLETSST